MFIICPIGQIINTGFLVYYNFLFYHSLNFYYVKVVYKKLNANLSPDVLNY